MIVQTPNYNSDVQKHQHNKKKFTNENLYTQSNDPKFFSFTTHNVRSYTLDVKLSQIEQFFTNYNIDILGLSETHFNKSQAFYYSSNLKSKPDRFLFHQTIYHKTIKTSVLLSETIYTIIFFFTNFFLTE